MKINQSFYSSGKWVKQVKSITKEQSKNLTIIYGDNSLIANNNIKNEVKNLYPNSKLIFCSSSHIIYKNEVFEESLTATNIEFEKTDFKIEQINIRDFKNSFVAGNSIASKFEQNNLKLLLILSDGTKVNGSQLVSGINEIIPNEIPTFGGLACDGAKFNSTIVGIDEDLDEGNIIGIAFYGDINVATSSKGGWDVFGPERIVTKSKNNILYEIDQSNALDLYKCYLGEFAKELPGSALLFPLTIIDKENEEQSIVRTILAINEEDKSMTFAGDIPEGSSVRLMKANFDRLIDGAATAGKNATLQQTDPELVMLISCIGRKLVLQDRTDEEIEAVREELSENSVFLGFYSHGEISSQSKELLPCNLHNQTMTILSLSEF